MRGLNKHLLDEKITSIPLVHQSQPFVASNLVRMTDSEKQQDDVLPWDQDPDNPQNWSKLKKTINLGIVSMLALIT